MKEKIEQQLKIVEHKSEAIAAQNFEYAVENVSHFMLINNNNVCVSYLGRVEKTTQQQHWDKKETWQRDQPTERWQPVVSKQQE